VHRPLPPCLFLNPLPNAPHLSLLSIPRPFSPHGRRRPLLPFRPHNTTRSTRTQRTPTMVPSPHHCRVPKRPPARRTVSQAVHTVVFLPHSCTAQVPSRLPTPHPAPASHLPRVRARRHITHYLHKRLPPLLLHPLPLPQPLPSAPVPPCPVPRPHSSFPSRSVAQSRIAASHTSRRTGSSTT